MIEFMQTAITWLQAIVWGGFDAVTGFILGFLPDADSEIVQIVGGWAYIMQGADLDFNIYYFLDMPLVVGFLAIWSAVTLAGLVIIALRFVLDILHKIMDSIPVFG